MVAIDISFLKHHLHFLGPVLIDEIYGNSLISTVIDSCNCSDSSDIELSDDWAAKKSPKISRASKSPKLPR